MYEIILKSGLQALENLVIRNDKRLSEISDREQQIILETIKTKNQMVLMRFKYSLKIADELIGIQTKLVASLVEFKKEIIKHGNDLDWDLSKIEKSNFLEQVHRPLFRSFLDSRNKFEPLNDLFSIYSIEAQRFLEFTEVKKLIEKKFPIPTSVEKFCNFYSNIFGHVLGTLAALVRISSNDLRFWLVEKDYSTVAEEAAINDFKFMRSSLLREDNNQAYEATLETKEGIENFWNKVEQIK